MNRAHLAIASIAAVLPLALSACASQKPASEPAFADEGQQAGGVPITAKWSIPTVEGGQTHIAARIRHLMAVPVEVQIQVPEGVQVVSGRTRFTIAADGPKVVIEKFVLQGELADTAELVVVADAAGSDFGIHGKDVFTKKPKVLVQPNQDGPAVKVGNKSLGNAVPMKVDGQ
ncbi:MAG TPA: hypothetical protein VGK67_05010 [Myxococcales bacterium]|jgi:hypothetical protein